LEAKLDFLVYPYISIASWRLLPSALYIHRAFHANTQKCFTAINESKSPSSAVRGSGPRAPAAAEAGRAQRR